MGKELTEKEHIVNILRDVARNQMQTKDYLERMADMIIGLREIPKEEKK